jgi:hypothetical protein
MWHGYLPQTLPCLLSNGFAAVGTRDEMKDGLDVECILHLLLSMLHNIVENMDI